MSQCPHERQPGLPCAWPECPETVPGDKITGGAGWGTTELFRCSWWDDESDDTRDWHQEWAWMEMPSKPPVD